MRILRTTLFITLIAMLGCRQQQPLGQDKRAQMMLDSAASSKNATVVKPKESARPAEPITDFRELRNIMQHDINAMQRIPSKEVVYMKSGESARPSEKGK